MIEEVNHVFKRNIPKEASVHGCMQRGFRAVAGIRLRD